MRRKGIEILFAAVFLGGALIVSAEILSDGLKSFKSHDRIVTTKGLVEREVDANIGRWRLKLSIPGNDLAAVQREVDSKFTRVFTFFTDEGFSKDELIADPPKVQDLFAQSYRDVNVAVGGRYIVSQSLLVRTERVFEVERMRGKLGDLVREGIPLDDEDGPRYLYTKLNDIKPEMLNTAVLRAREAADQFAQLSGTRIAGIKNASQGVFQILAETDYEPLVIRKKVRVVSTITFLLK